MSPESQEVCRTGRSLRFLWSFGRGSLLPRFCDFEREQSNYECHDYENPLSLRLTRVVIVHEIANVKDGGSQVRDRNSKLVNPHEGRSRIRALIRSRRIRVAVRYEGILTRIRSIVTRCIELVDPVNNQIVRIVRIRPKHDNVPYLKRTRILAPYHNKSANRQCTVARRTHTSRRND
jgi:hypothetical protein